MKTKKKKKKEKKKIKTATWLAARLRFFFCRCPLWGKLPSDCVAEQRSAEIVGH